MHVFSSGGACARPSFPCEVVASRDAFSSRSGSKPCSPDAVLPDVTRHGSFISAPLDRCRPISLFSPRRRCRTLFAGCRGSVPSPSSAFRRLPHFQSSMLLHNLSSVFSLGRKASQRARRGSRVLLRTIATAHPAASPHHAAPRPACPAPAPFPAAAGFPQSFPHFCRFPTAAFFPLGFLGERQRQIF